MIVLTILFTAWSLCLFGFGLILGTWFTVCKYEREKFEEELDWNDWRDKLSGPLTQKEIKEELKQIRKAGKCQNHQFTEVGGNCVVCGKSSITTTKKKKKAKIQEVIW